MDEPSVGLHPRDVGRLVRVMHNLRDKGNTLLVVEHEEQIIRAAGNLLDLGPGQGERGGELVFAGKLDEFLTGDTPTPGARASSRLRPASCRTPGEVRGRDAANGGQDARAPHAERPSLTREYLTGRKTIPLPKSHRKFSASLKITGAREH